MWPSRRVDASSPKCAAAAADHLLQSRTHSHLRQLGQFHVLITALHHLPCCSTLRWSSSTHLSRSTSSARISRRALPRLVSGRSRPQTRLARVWPCSEATLLMSGCQAPITNESDATCVAICVGSTRNATVFCDIVALGITGNCDIHQVGDGVSRLPQTT